jgi:hypothetical protein
LRRQMMGRDHHPPTGHESRQHGLLRRAVLKRIAGAAAIRPPSDVTSSLLRSRSRSRHRHVRYERNLHA